MCTAGFTRSHTTHTIHATGSRAKLSTKKSIKSIAVDQSRVERRVKYRVDQQLSWIDRIARLDRFRGLMSGNNICFRTTSLQYSPATLTPGSKKSFAEHISHVLLSVSQRFYLLKLGMCGKLKFGQCTQDMTPQQRPSTTCCMSVVCAVNEQRQLVSSSWSTPHNSDHSAFSMAQRRKTVSGQ